MGDFLSRLESKAHAAAIHKVGKKLKCGMCGLYGCICQLSLSDWVPIRKVIKEPSHAQKVGNCPHRCANADKDCIDCYDFNKFKGVVVL